MRFCSTVQPAEMTNHHHHHGSGGGDAGFSYNNTVPDHRIIGPVRTIIILVSLFVSCSAAEHFSRGWVILNAWLLGAGILFVITTVIVRAVRRPHLIRRALETARGETAREFTGVVERRDDLVGASSPNVVARELTIRCRDGSLIRVVLPTEIAGVRFDVGHRVVKRAGDRWPVDASVGFTPARPVPRREQRKCYQLSSGAMVHVQPGCDCGHRVHP
jgi:hypothetical protein